MVQALEQTTQETNVSFSERECVLCGCCGQPVVGDAYRDETGIAYHTKNEKISFVRDVLNDF